MSRQCGLLALRNVHLRRQILHVQRALIAAYSQRDGLTRLAPPVHKHRHDTSKKESTKWQGTHR
jgi:hypothetical protein